MRVKISYHGQAKMALETDCEDTEVEDGASVGTIIKLVVSRHSCLRELLLDESGELRRGVLFPLNDEVVDIDTAGIVKDGDEIAIFPAIAGG